MSKLYIIPTPIGNLKDITLRAIDILKKVDLILAEDTRTSRKLLKHYDIDTTTNSLHMHNEHRLTDRYIKRIKEGVTIAIISDAGTPLISDPGSLFVQHCIKESIEIECLPGATAFLPALVSSGLNTKQFVFEGFLPLKKGRVSRLKCLMEEQRTMIFYESPHRVLKTLNQFSEYFGEERSISASREITKLYEETKRGSVVTLIKYFEEKKPKGEFVFIVEGKK
jgi:16S rRNA (cytidine1402-2'-O)-methyltransferase